MEGLRMSFFEKSLFMMLGINNSDYFTLTENRYSEFRVSRFIVNDIFRVIPCFFYQNFFAAYETASHNSLSRLYFDGVQYFKKFT